MKNETIRVFHSGDCLLSPIQNMQQPGYNSLKVNPTPDCTSVDLANITIISNFGPESQILKCPFCHHFVTTKVKSKATMKTHMLALLACFSCCWICCCCPYCIDSCLDRHHYCPQCRSYLGSYRA